MTVSELIQCLQSPPEDAQGYAVALIGGQVDNANVGKPLATIERTRLVPLKNAGGDTVLYVSKSSPSDGTAGVLLLR